MEQSNEVFGAGTMASKPHVTGLFLERAREPVALYFVVGLSGFAGSEPGWLSQN